jgi:uncharacterized protein (TIGR02001 family)
VNRFGSWTAGVGLCAASVCSPAALAVTTGHVGVFSDYIFRGIVANGGAAVQGGIDHIHDNGLLAGVWASNTAAFGGSELDLYAGYLYKFSDTLMVDVGALYYVLSEDKESALYDVDGDGTPDTTDLDTLEFFTTLFWGPLKLQAYYSDDYVATNEEGFYYTATYTYKVNDTITIAGQVGYTHGDGPEYFYGDKYWDYSLMLNKTIREGLVFSLGYIDTNLKDEGAGFVFSDEKDDPKVMISAKQTFSF